MTIDLHVSQIEHIYQLMLAKVHTNIKKQVSQQKYYNMQTFNNPFEKDEKVLKKNMPDNSYREKMKTKWAGSYTIAEVSAMGGSINSRINIAIS